MFFIKDLHVVKNYLPIIYTTHDLNSCLKLILLYKNAKIKYPEINLFFVFHDEIAKIFDYNFVMSESMFSTYKQSYIKNYYLKAKNNMDVVETFCEENKIEIFLKNAKNQNFDNIYSFDNIQNGQNVDFKKVYKIGKISEVTCDNYAIAGRETPEIINFAYLGRKILLLNKQNNNNSFQKMFPDTIVL